MKSSLADLLRRGVLAGYWSMPRQGRRIFQAGTYSIIGFVVGRGVRVGSRLVLTWFLLPELFGLMAIVASVIAGLQMLSDIGIETCIVQNADGEDDRFLRSAYTIQVIRGILLWLIACAITIPLASFYGEQLLHYVLPVASLIVLMNGFMSTGKAVSVRKVELRRLTFLMISAETAGAITAIVLGALYANIWALVSGVLVTAAVMVSGSHFLLPRTDHFGWDARFGRTIFRFGGLIFLSTGTWFLALHGEKLVLAKVLDLETVGVLVVALLVVSTVRDAIYRVVSQVALPVLSESVRQGHDVMTRSYVRLSHVRLLIALVVSGALVLGAEPAVSLLLPDIYRGAGWMIQILALRVLVDVLQVAPSTLMFAQASLGWVFAANLVRAVVILAGCPVVLYFGGIRAVVWLLALSPLASYLIYVVGIWIRHGRLARLELLSLLLSGVVGWLLFHLLLIANG